MTLESLPKGINRVPLWGILGSLPNVYSEAHVGLRTSIGKRRDCEETKVRRSTTDCVIHSLKSPRKNAALVGNSDDQPAGQRKCKVGWPEREGALFNKAGVPDFVAFYSCSQHTHSKNSSLASGFDAHNCEIQTAQPSLDETSS